MAAIYLDLSALRLPSLDPAVPDEQLAPGVIEAVGHLVEAGSSEIKGAGGYIELKYIRGYGPYAYKRYRAGGRLCSEYVGKVKQ